MHPPAQPQQSRLHRTLSHRAPTQVQALESQRSTLSTQLEHLQHQLQHDAERARDENQRLLQQLEEAGQSAARDAAAAADAQLEQVRPGYLPSPYASGRRNAHGRRQCGGGGR